MTITTPRLTLRPLTTADAATTFAYAGDPANTRYMLFLPYSNLAEAMAELAKMEQKMTQSPRRDYFFAIEAEGEHIGEISLELTADLSEAELGWILRRDCQGKGYMTEAARAVLRFARTLPGLRLLYAHCDSGNHASAAVMERLGMTLAERGTRQNRGSDTPSEDCKYILPLTPQSCPK